MSNNTLYLLSPRLCFLIVLNHDIFVNRDDYAPHFEKVDWAYCFWSVRGWVRGWVTLFVPIVTFKPLKLEL